MPPPLPIQVRRGGVTEGEWLQTWRDLKCVRAGALEGVMSLEDLLALVVSSLLRAANTALAKQYLQGAGTGVPLPKDRAQKVSAPT